MSHSEVSTIKMFVKQRLIIAYIVLGLLSWQAIFLLPIAFPPKTPTVSESFTFGFNNRLCISIVLFFLFLFYFLSRYWNPSKLIPLLRTSPEMEGCSTRPIYAYVDKNLILLMAVLSTIMVIALYYISYGSFYGEAKYFIIRCEYLIKGRFPYREFEYAYAPLLIYIPAYLHVILSKIGFSVKAAYYLFYAVANIFGLVLMAYIINAFDSNRREKNILFLAFSAIAMNETMGAQYLAIRYITPVACLIFINNQLVQSRISFGPKSKKTQYVLLGFGLVSLVINWLISPEIGLAYWLSLSAYTLYLGLTMSRVYFLHLFLLAVASIFFVGLFSFHYFDSVSAFLAGGNMFPVLPTLYMVLYLASLFYLLPILARSATESLTPVNAIWIGLFTLCLVLMVGALGQNDFLHVFLYGFPVFLLTALSLRRLGEGVLQRYCLALVLVFFCYKVSHFHFNYEKTILTNLGKRVFERHEGLVRRVAAFYNKSSDVEHFKGSLKDLDYSPLAARGPVLLPLQVEEKLFSFLRSRGKVLDEYYFGMINVFTKSNLDRKLKDLKKSDFVVVHQNTFDDRRENQTRWSHRYISYVYLYPFNWEPVASPFNPEAIITEYLRTNFKVIDKVGEYLLLSRDKSE